MAIMSVHEQLFLGSWQRATKRIREGKPVMIGILKVLGSTLQSLGDSVRLF